jgi:hypothetical protein
MNKEIHELLCYIKENIRTTTSIYQRSDIISRVEQCIKNNPLVELEELTHLPHDVTVSGTIKHEHVIIEQKESKSVPPTKVKLNGKKVGDISIALLLLRRCLVCMLYPDGYPILRSEWRDSHNVADIANISIITGDTYNSDIHVSIDSEKRDNEPLESETN